MGSCGKIISCNAAVVWAPHKPMSVERIQVHPPDAGEIAYAALCHTDYFFLMESRDQTVRFPIVLGHEGAGVVESVGAGVQSVSVGDHVVPCAFAQCRQCANCHDSKSNLCDKYFGMKNMQTMETDGQCRFECAGQKLFHFGRCSTFSEFTVVPEAQVCKIDSKMPLDRACLLGCGVPTGYGAPLNGCAVNVGDVVGVWGLGTIGLAAVMGAVEAGACHVVAVDPNEKRFKMAKELGATECVKPEEGLQKYFFQKFNGGLDIAFEATGNIKAMRQAFECTKRGSGRTCIMGVTEQELNIPTSLLLQNRTIKGFIYGGWKCRDDVPMLAQKYTEGKLKLNEFASWQCSLSEINEAVGRIARGDGLRSIIKMGSE
uniref:Uncharacterized protein n=1 Tax=Globodera rostochiensis TaxID=31243 RepID=A0A914HUR7_GLORO